MLAYEEALREVLARAWRLDAETLAFDAALGRVLAEDIRCDMDYPPFNASAMDGYACRRDDARDVLSVARIVAAGDLPPPALNTGECMKVMTGAPVPENADCVLIVEQVESTGEHSIRFTGEKVTSNIRLRGEDVRADTVVLYAGARIGPAQLAMLASAGAVKPRVARAPRVGICSTGNELVPPHAKPGPGQIRDSNSAQLAALAARCNATVRNFGAAADTFEALRAGFAAAIAASDVILSTGGVSMGDYDLVPKVLESLGFAPVFTRVAIQPGKPIWFGVANGKACFGLSGNPVSSLIQFELLVKPFLLAIQGASGAPCDVMLPLGEAFERKGAGRMKWAPVRIRDGRAFPVPFHGSAHLGALAAADGLLAFPIGVERLDAGTLQPVRLLS